MTEHTLKPVTGRAIAALLHPRLALLVTCCDRSGKPNVLAVAWHTPLSHQPPLIGIAIAPIRFSHHLIREQGEFVANVMGLSLQKAVAICGTYSGEVENKFALAGLKTHPAECVCPPRLVDALGVLECKVMDQMEMGDHTFFVGQVLKAQARSDCFSTAWETQGDDAGLQYLQRERYGAFVELKAHDEG